MIEKIKCALAALLLLAVGCTKVGTATVAMGGRHAYTHPHELRYAVATDVEHLNTLTSATVYEMYLASLCMAFLIKTDAQGNATVPELITEVPSQANGDISKDGKSITWHLRHGVTWSDGAPFDADDVVFTTKQVLNPANNVVSLDGWDLIDKIDEPDKYTVVYHLKKPYSSFAVTFFSTGGANPSVLPAHLLRGLRDLNTTPYNGLPVGIGPFKYQAWNRGDSVVMVRDPNYFRGAAKLDRIIFKILPDKNTTLEQLRTHELDMWIPVSPHFYPQTQAIPGIVGSSIPSFVFDHLDFNLARPILSDIRVREALRYGLDRPELVRKVQNGLYLLDESPVTPASRYHLNLEFAGQTGQPDYDTELELIRGWWKSLGVELTVKHYLSSQFFATIANGGILYAGKFDVTRFGWGADPNEDMSNLYACYRFPPDGQDVPRWCDRAATAAMDRAKENYNPAQRTKDLDFVQQAVYDQVPTVVLDARKQLAAYNSDLKNWHPNSVSAFDDMMKVDI